MSPTLEDIQDALLDKFHAGEPVDRDAALQQHPEHALALERFFRVMDLLETPTVGTEAPGRLGEYEMGREIGRGGMGIVYEALQLSLKRPVALKILPPAMRHDRRLLKRFQREAEAAGRLRHPNIVPVYSIGESGGTPFFAMELVDGHSLAQIITTWKAVQAGGAPDVGDGTLPTPHSFLTGAARVRWIVELMAKVLDALDYAHVQGIVHRDVKPGNILVEADGTPRLTDFGLALDMDASELTQVGEVFGSPLYMSPEQAFRAEAPVDSRTDIYSVAVTLYELLTLRLPYAGRTRAALVAALGEGRIVPPRDVSGDVSPAMAAVLERALQLDPGRRYHSAAAFAQALRAALAEPEVVVGGVGVETEGDPAAGDEAETSDAGATVGVAMGAAIGAGVSVALDASPWIIALSTSAGTLSCAVLGAWVQRASAAQTAAAAAAPAAAPAPAPAPAPAEGWGARHPFLAGLVVLAMVGLLVLVISVVFMLVKQSNEQPEVSVQYESQPASGILADELVLMADGRHPDGEELLERSLSTSRLMIRDTLSRSEPSLAWVEWTHPGVQLSEDMWFGHRLDVAVGDGEWALGSWGFSAYDESMISLDVHSVTQRLYVPLDEIVLPDLDSIILRVRVSLRVQRLSLQSRGEAFQGTQASWTESRRLTLVDEYPADYPRPITGPAELAAHYTPVELGMNAWQGHDGVLLMHARFAPRPGGLPLGAFDVALYGPGGDELIARGPLVLGGRGPMGFHSTLISFEVDAEAGPGVAAVVQALLSGDQPVRLDVRLEPSRDLALSKQAGNDYWAQPISATLDIGRSFQPVTQRPEQQGPVDG